MTFSKQILGSSLSLLAYGREGQGQHLLFKRRISQSEIQNSAAAESEGGQKFLPPNPLPFCPPERSVWHAKRAVSSVQKRFGFRQTNAHFYDISNLIIRHKRQVRGPNPVVGTSLSQISKFFRLNFDVFEDFPK